MEDLLTTGALVSLLTLTLMEIVLGIDNIIFISIVASRAPLEKQAQTRRLGLLLALGVRVLLLMFITHLASMTAPLFTVMGKGFSGRDLILLAGGLFLIGKTVSELHHKLAGARAPAAPPDPEAPAVQLGHGVTSPEPRKGAASSMRSIIVQIILIDVVFSFDSILTAIGLSRQLPIMVAAVVISMVIMIIFAGTVARFIDRNPTIKILALAFLIMIGFLLVAEGLGQHVNKGYVYFAMAFALGVELINMRISRHQAVQGPTTGA